MRARARPVFLPTISTWRSRSRVMNFSDGPRATIRRPWCAEKTNATNSRTDRRAARSRARPFSPHSRFTPRGPRMGERRHTTSTRYDTRHEDRGSWRRWEKDTCCTARWVAVSGLCDSLSSVRICLSPSSCGCHAIFIVFFNSTTVTRSLPSLTSQINGSSLQRSLSLFLSSFPSPATGQPILPPLPGAPSGPWSCEGAPRPFSSGKRLPCFRFTRFSACFRGFGSFEKTRENRLAKLDSAGHRNRKSDNNAVRRGILKPGFRAVRISGVARIGAGKFVLRLPRDNGNAINARFVPSCFRAPRNPQRTCSRAGMTVKL